MKPLFLSSEMRASLFKHRHRISAWSIKSNKVGPLFARTYFVVSDYVLAHVLVSV
jgi:hypothetical protein